MSTVRKSTTTTVVRPAGRYFKNKAPRGAADAASDSSDEEEEEEDVGEDDDATAGDLLAQRGTAAGQPRKEMDVKLGKMGVTSEGKVTGGKTEESSEEEETSSDEEEEEDVKPKFRLPPKSGVPAPAAGDGESSSEYETDSEEEEAPKPALRPTFVPKRARETILARDATALTAEEAEEKAKAEAVKRKQEAHEMVAESIKRELAEKETPDLVPDVDDTDSPETAADDFAAWRLRELQRLSRDRQALTQREEERAEVERRRAMPEEQRNREDTERAEKSRREKPKGQQMFLQKFWHKGAFHQDDEILKNRDFTAPTESTVDMSALPAVMQKRNFGKMSQSKYTHLADQDTTRNNGGFGGHTANRPGGGGPGCFTCGGPHLKKDCPQNSWNQPSGSGSTFGDGAGGPPGATGSNMSALGSRTWGARDDDRRRDRYDDDRKRPDDHDRDRRPPPPGEGWGRNDEVRRPSSGRERSRSRSRERYRGGGRDEYSSGGGRRRSRSRDRDGGRDRDRDGEKRRRYD